MSESLRVRFPSTRTIIWDVDVSSLEVPPVLIGNPAERGVWFAGSSFFGARP